VVVVGVHSLRDQAGVTATGGIIRDDVAVDLRILATTDLHAQLTARDWVTGKRRPDIGLTRVATLIRTARGEAVNTLLFDNGDAIEGSALADHAVATGHRTPHPLVAAMNTLGYDAATLGNHEFSLGLPFLQAAIAAAAHPVVSANILWAGDRQPFVPSHVLLDRQLRDRLGRMRRLRVGVFGLTPPQVLVWEARHIAGRLTAHGMVEGARMAVAALRAEGADIVVALCHTGLTGNPDDSENPGLALAVGAGADVMILGHGHQVFPGPDFADLPGADVARGTIAARPVAMPGAHGSHLGVVDLVLRQERGRWRVDDARAEARPVGRAGASGAVAEDAALLGGARRVERRVTRWLAHPAGETEADLESYFALVADGPLLRTIAAAKAAWLVSVARGTPLARLPMLAAVAPFRAGGRGGPLNYVDIPAGRLTRRRLAELYSHPNGTAAVVVSGASVADWLERGVSGYVRQMPGRLQMLIDPDFPAFAFEPIHGLSYRIDVTQPARFDAQGNLANPAARRIRDLCWDGRPIDPAARFAVATNSYRASLLARQVGAEIIDRIDSATLSRDVLAAWMTTPLRARTPALAAGGWSFCGMGGQPVLYDTGPGAVRHLHRIAAMAPRVLGPTAAGFLRLELVL
jgi:2',3'-cyclic-nucleotide 2'-phosphodiesterase / 3'-nucleotidase